MSARRDWITTGLYVVAMGYMTVALWRSDRAFHELAEVSLEIQDNNERLVRLNRESHALIKALRQQIAGGTTATPPDGPCQQAMRGGR